MRTAILVVHKPGGPSMAFGDPAEMREKFKGMVAAGVPGATSIDLWESGSGIVRKHKVKVPVEPEPEKRGPGRPRKTEQN